MMSNKYDRRIRRYKSTIFKLKFIFTTTISIIVLAVIGYTYFIFNKIDERDQTILNLVNQVHELSRYRDKIENLGITITDIEDSISELNSQIEEKESVIDSLDSIIEEKQSVVDELSTDIDTINNYEYALYDTEGNRNDITLELLEFGIAKCNEEEINPDLLFGIIMVESEGHAEATNTSSGAAGLGQFLPGTGEFIANEYLDLSYEHSTTPYDAQTSIAMIVEYLAHLKDKYYGDIVSMLMEYSGGDLNYAYNYYAKVINAVGHDVS